MYETLLYCEVHEFSFPTSPYLPKIDSEQESCVHFFPALQSVPNFRTRNVQCSCHISLYGSSNSLILDALEREFHGASEYQLFLPCTSLSMCKIVENSGACSRTLEMLTNLISSLITNSWECSIMPAKQSSAHTTPGVTVGS